ALVVDTLSHSPVIHIFLSATPSPPVYQRKESSAASDVYKSHFANSPTTKPVTDFHHQDVIHSRRTINNPGNVFDIHFPGYPIDLKLIIGVFNLYAYRNWPLHF
ncbi:hypothetical protein DD888_03955, partial [Staphylococcus pseudintermedius]